MTHLVRFAYLTAPQNVRDNIVVPTFVNDMRKQYVFYGWLVQEC